MDMNLLLLGIIKKWMVVIEKNFVPNDMKHRRNVTLWFCNNCTDVATWHQHYLNIKKNVQKEMYNAQNLLSILNYAKEKKECTEENVHAQICWAPHLADCNQNWTRNCSEGRQLFEQTCLKSRSEGLTRQQIRSSMLCNN